MIRSLYITTTDAHCGKSLVSLGVMELLLRKTQKVAFFRPIISNKYRDSIDKHIELMLKHFNLQMDYEDSFAFYQDEANCLVGEGRNNEMLDKILQKFEYLKEKNDFILCEGTNFQGSSSAFESDINAEIAKNLASPVLIVGNGQSENGQEVWQSIKMAIDSYEERSCKILGTIINRTSKKIFKELQKSISNNKDKNGCFFSLIPESKTLSGPTMQEVANHLQAKVLYGKEYLSRQVGNHLIAAMHLEHYLDYISDNCLVITPSDRGDIVLGSMLSHQSANYPSIAGIVLTTGYNPKESIARLLDGLKVDVPILRVDINTFETAKNLNKIHAHINADSYQKINYGLENFEKWVNGTVLEERIINIKSSDLTPKMFEYNLAKKARSEIKHIVLPEGEDERIIRATEILLHRKLVKITLLGDEAKIREKINRIGSNIADKVQFIDPAKFSRLNHYAQELFNLRKHKGLTLEGAQDLLMDVSYFGTVMVQLGDADGMVSGAIHTTQHTIRPALQIIKMLKGVSVVSSLFFMCLDDRVLIYADCAVNTNPDAATLAEIAISSADTAQSFGIEPLVAMLSYSSGSSGKGEEVEKVRLATVEAQDRSEYLIEGPMQYDAAVDLGVAKKKLPNSKVAGRASVLIFPDLNTGNNTYKAVQRETKALAIGPILQGLNRPVNDLSRGCTVPDIINTVVVTAIQAQNFKKGKLKVGNFSYK